MARTHVVETGSLLSRSRLCALAAALVSCATYEGSQQPYDLGSAQSGTGGALAGGGAGGLGGASTGLAGGGASAGGGVAGTLAESSGGVAGVAASAGDTGSSGSSAGGTGGSTNVVGGAGNGGGASGSANGGSAGRGGNGGSAGSGIVDSLLSLNRPASADSEQTSEGHTAALGNDGSSTTRWCANDGATNHYWQVDLGALYTLSRIEVTWEKVAVYQFKVEGSPDNAAWSTVQDATKSTVTSGDQTFSLGQSPRARWLRITITGLQDANTWASFFEFAAYGH